MSYYYQYNFVSPDPIYAIVQEELKSYFDTGAVDNLLFPTYLDKCLRKLGRATYVISTDILEISNFECRLPDNFHAVREAWMCSEIPQLPYQNANSFYSQASSITSLQLSPLTVGGSPCTNSACSNPSCEGTCLPEMIQAVYKTNNSIARSFKREYLLAPGNISAKGNCDVAYTHNFTPGSSTIDSFDIRDNKFVTNFRNGVVNLVFYATEYDNTGNQLVPDNYRIKEYIEAFLKYKVFETLTNQINDETFNQLHQKLADYKQLSDEAFIMADVEIKKQTAWDKQRRIKQSLNRFQMFELPDRGAYKYGRRRNN